MRVKWALLVLVAVVFAVFSTNVSAFRLNFAPVTTYTDGATITGVTIMYDAWQDNVPLASVSASPFQTLDNTYGGTHTYRMRTRLSDGRVSKEVVATLTSPLDSRLPAAPEGAPLSITE